MGIKDTTRRADINEQSKNKKSYEEVRISEFEGRQKTDAPVPLGLSHHP